MMVSYARGADSETAAAEPTSLAAEDMAGMPACHAQHKKNRKVTTSKTSAAFPVGQFDLPGPARSGAMNCCPLTSGSIAATSRPQSNSPASALANTGSQLTDFLTSRTATVAVPLRLPNRAHSYLLGCAFLI
jgi:hypothetical protein